MIIAESPRLIIRNWEERDREVFHALCSDETVMTFFPKRLSRGESDALFPTIRDQISETGYGFPAMALRETGEAIGFCGLNVAYRPDIRPKGVPEIGWRLITTQWGKGYVTEAAHAMIDLAFTVREHSQIVSFAVADNRRSIAVMERLGMTQDEGASFDHPSVPDTHPHLKRHVLYRLRKQDWPSLKKRA
ncbi:GNAT family N-acetyltransferase [Martelella mediterranea]|uniref:RimJ/RimL family protein N-acetyltransferase n=1 Tax=Martelella mediterranea TaxID=293089 RepID=A0A4R3NQB1_9HYPH|nr:GNAT family N-acetyltransferase [Martelella mediterranea]TCT37163.1 RimJ/RimL family protein N-acetyltransferase [Martelella mediterranea]